MYTRTRINIKNNTVFFFKFKYVLIIFKKRFTNTNVISRKVVNVRFPNPNNELLFIRHETVSLHYTKTLRIRPNDFSPFLAVLKKKKRIPPNNAKLNLISNSFIWGHVHCFSNRTAEERRRKLLGAAAAKFDSRVTFIKVFWPLSCTAFRWLETVCDFSSTNTGAIFIFR